MRFPVDQVTPPDREKALRHFPLGRRHLSEQELLRASNPEHFQSIRCRRLAGKGGSAFPAGI